MTFPIPIAGRHALSTVAAVLLSFAPLSAFAFDPPANDGYVTDTAGILTAAEKETLEQSLRAYQASTSNEIAVVTIKSLNGDVIEDAGLQIGRKWGIGSAGKNNGILLLIAYDDHEVRFDVGYGLEGAVPDIVAKGIIDTDIVPNFRNGDYYTGITTAVASLQKHIGGEYTADRYTEKESGGSPGAFLFFGFVLLQWLISILGRTKSWWLGGVFGGVAGVVLASVFGLWLAIPILIPFGLFLDFVVSKNFKTRGPTRWWAGGTWGPGGMGGSGGGFGGFGGGSFGGGGASGRW